jgi:HEAT repeat protein
MADGDKKFASAAASTLPVVLERAGEKLLAESIAGVLAHLRSGRAEVRGNALQALWRMGDFLKEKALEHLVGAVLELFSDREARIRRDAICVFWKMRLDAGPLCDRVGEAILPRLKDEDAGVRLAATYTLGNLGKRLGDGLFRKAMGGLPPLLADPSTEVRYHAACWINHGLREGKGRLEEGRVKELRTAVEKAIATETDPATLRELREILQR